MDKLIYPCIWCNNNAEEIAYYYTSVFPKTEIVDHNQWAVVLNMNGQRLMLLNGGDMFKPNPSLSIMYLTTSENDIEDIYNKLVKKGKELMPLDSYPFSSKYAWLEDEFGVSWQLIKAEQKDIVQQIVPTLMFVGNNNGKAEEAIDFYTSIFPNSQKRGVSKYTGSEGETKANIWSRLTSNGGEEGMCGWLKDKYGVNWQITPVILKDLLSQSPKVMEVMMTKKKLDIDRLQSAVG